MGEKLDAVLDSVNNNYNYDGTGMSICYIKEGDVEDSMRVINVDITGASDSTGRFSAHTGLGREGWSDWNKWNALRLGAATSAECRNCVEADGMTRRNVSVTLTRDSGEAISSANGSGASTLLNNYVSSTNASDTYTFTISALKENEPYTLWLYSAKGNATGNAVFTVGGETKGVEETWAIRNTKTLTRFKVESDANGKITGTFAAADDNGGAFNGFTLIGDLPDYIATGTMIIVR